jgi:hypothetical protein
MKAVQLSYFRSVGFRNLVRIGIFCALFVPLNGVFVQLPTVSPVSPGVARLLEAILLIALFLLILVAKWSRRSPPNDGGPRGSALGKPVPDDPGPRHHLVAAKALPPSKKTYLFQKD